MSEPVLTSGGRPVGHAAALALRAGRPTLGVAREVAAGVICQPSAPHRRIERQPERGSQRLVDAASATHFGELSSGAATSYFDEVLRLLTAMAFPADPALAPWGISLKRPRGAQVGVVGIEAAGERPARSRAQAATLTVREHFFPNASVTRLMFVAGTSLPLALLTSLPAWVIALIVSSFHTAIAGGRHTECVWRAELPLPAAKEVLRAQDSFRHRLGRLTGYGVPTAWWTRRPSESSPWRWLQHAGDSVVLAEQAGFGATAACSILWGLFRAGAPFAAGRGRSLLMRRRADSLDLCVTPKGSHRSTSAALGLLWIGGSEASGTSHEQTLRAQVAWPSAAGLLTTIAFADIYRHGPSFWPATWGAPAAGQRPSAQPPLESGRVHSHGGGWHLPFEVPVFRSLGHGTVRTAMARQVAAPLPTQPLVDAAVTVRGLDQSLRAGRTLWQCSLSASLMDNGSATDEDDDGDAAFAAGRAGPERLLIRWHFASLLTAGTARTLPGWLERTNAMAAELESNVTARPTAVAGVPAEAAAKAPPWVPAAELRGLWLSVAGETHWPPQPPRAAWPGRRPAHAAEAAVLRPLLASWLGDRGPRQQAPLLAAMRDQGTGAFAAIDALLRPAGAELAFEMTAASSEQDTLAAARLLVDNDVGSLQALRSSERLAASLARQQACWRQLAALLPPGPSAAAAAAAGRLQAIEYDLSCRGAL